MRKDNFEYSFVDLEKESKKLIKITLSVCEAELANHNDNIKGLPHAAMAVRESILAFLSLVDAIKKQ